jgi:hypothetical protein
MNNILVGPYEKFLQIKVVVQGDHFVQCKISGSNL